MKLQLDYEVYQWLLTLKVLKSSLPYQQKKTGRFELDTIQTVLFQNGKKFLEIAINLSFLSEKAINFDKYSLKEGNTATIRLNNWNILLNLFHLIGFDIDPDIKNLIVSGDLEIINECLKDIYTIASNSIEKLSESFHVFVVFLEKFQQFSFFLLFRLKTMKMIKEKQALLKNVN